MATVLLAAAVGLLLGSALGLFGGGGGILAVPMLVGLLGMDVDQAATASLVIVLFGALGGLVSHHRAGRVLWRAGLVFGATSIVGATVGSLLAARVPDWIKLSAFLVLMVAAGVAMLRNARRQPATRPVAQPSLVATTGRAGGTGPDADPGAALIDIPAADLPVPPGRARPRHQRRIPRHPCLADLLDPPDRPAGHRHRAGHRVPRRGWGLPRGARPRPLAAHAGGQRDSHRLVVIAIASTSALVVRLTHSATMGQPALIAEIVVATVIASLFAARFSNRMSPRALGTGFAVLVLAMSLLVAVQALQAFHAA